MQITAQDLFVPTTVLGDLRDENWFRDFVTSQYIYTASPVSILPRISPSALVDAHGQWVTDLKRVKNFELGDRSEPDHFKQAGHLTYWLRRSQPVYDVKMEASGTPPNFHGNPLAEIFHRLIMVAPNEYLAFDLGYRIVLLHECYSQDPPKSESEFALTDDYIVTMVQFLRNKNVSPHALFLIFKSLFLQR